jgi:choloylglycine hydrolase
MKKSIGIILLTAILLVSAGKAEACTTFCLNNGKTNVYGKNYDWSVGDGAVILNKRGLSKTAMKANDETGVPATWKSKYGSITFNQNGREFPQGGMNEAGLVVEILVVPVGQYPAADTRPYVRKTQYRQYLLDNFSTVKEVIDSDSTIRVSGAGKGPMTHLFLSDKNGAAAVIEFIDGKRVIYTRESLPVKVLSNTAYADSLSYWKANNVPAGDKWKSVERFNRAAESAKSYTLKPTNSPVDYAFETLKQVSQGDMTQWSIVYDIENRRVFFTTLINQKKRSIDMKEVDFSCKSPIMMVDINAGSENIAKSFQPYSMQANRKLIADVFGKTDFLKDIPEQIIEGIAVYPDSAKCEER